MSIPNPGIQPKYESYCINCIHIDSKSIIRWKLRKTGKKFKISKIYQKRCDENRFEWIVMSKTYNILTLKLLFENTLIKYRWF